PTYNYEDYQDYFYAARDHESVSRFGLFRLRLPICPANMRVVRVRFNIYAWTGTDGPGTMGFAALKDNPDLTQITWNSAVSDDYIAGRSNVNYVVLLETNSVELAETLSDTPIEETWETAESNIVLTNGLAKTVSDALSGTTSNILTLMTFPLSGYGETYWRAGSLEVGSNATVEVDFVTNDSALSVPVTNNLLVALQGSSSLTNSDGSVSVWADNASLGGWQDFSQSVSDDQPWLLTTNMPNGQPFTILDFAESEAPYLELGETSALVTNTLTWFTVFRPEKAGGGTTRSILCTAGAVETAGGPSVQDYQWGSFMNGGDAAARLFVRNSEAAMKTADFLPDNTNQWFVMCGNWNGTTGAMNGNAAGTLTGRLLAEDRTAFNNIVITDTDADVVSHIMTRIGRLANIYDNTRVFDGQIAEILIYNTALSSPDTEAVMEYLDLKYFKQQGTLILIH
nr:hypothetical protein [Kiritimatiellia bacterium]